MNRTFAVIALLALGACAAPAPLLPSEFVSTAGANDSARERALAECQYQAQAHAETIRAAHDARRSYFVGQFEGNLAKTRALRNCMAARGYTWTSPRNLVVD